MASGSPAIPRHGAEASERRARESRKGTVALLDAGGMQVGGVASRLGGTGRVSDGRVRRLPQMQVICRWNIVAWLDALTLPSPASGRGFWMGGGRGVFAGAE